MTTKTSLFLPEYWDDCGEYYLNKTPQTEPMKGDVDIKRLTASHAPSAIGAGEPYESIQDLVDFYHGKKKVIDEKQYINIERGVRLEPMVRRWYEKRMSCLVRQVGHAVPKWDLQIGTSADGFPIRSLEYILMHGEGIIEIKVAENMYKSLNEYMARKAYMKDFDAPKDTTYASYSHILKKHYIQMIKTMAIAKRQYCDYIVYCEKEQRIFIQRIPFDEEEWLKIYSGVRKFIDENQDIFSKTVKSIIY